MADIVHRPTVFVVECAAGVSVAFEVPGNALSVRVRCRDGVAKWSDAGTPGEALETYSTLYATESVDLSPVPNFTIPFAETLYFDCESDVESGESFGDAAVVEVIVS